MKTYLLIILIFGAIITAAWPAALDTAKIDQLTGLKGKTNEKVGALGRNEAIAVHAVALLVRSQEPGV